MNLFVFYQLQPYFDICVSKMYCCILQRRAFSLKCHSKTLSDVYDQH